MNIGILEPIGTVSKSENRARLKHSTNQRNRADLKKLHYDGARMYPKKTIELKRQIFFDLVRLPIDQVHDDSLLSRHYFEQLRTIAEHYGLFNDLFKHGYFIPRIPLHVHYPYEKDQITPVYSGNRLYASDMREKPQVEWKSLNEEKEFYTLVLTNLDGHLQEDNAEVLQWFVYVQIDDFSQKMIDLFLEEIFLVPPLRKEKPYVRIYHHFLLKVPDGIDASFYYINIKMDRLISLIYMDLFPAIGKPF